MRRVLGLALLVAACGARSPRADAPPRDCDHDLTAYVHNIGFAPLDVFLGGAIAGAVGPGNSGRFVVSRGNYLSIRPSPTSPPTAGDPKYEVSYKCEE